MRNLSPKPGRRRLAATGQNAPTPVDRPDGRAHAARLLAALTFAASALVLARSGVQLHALAKAAGYSGSAGGGTFAKVSSYMTGLRTAILPLSIPIGSLGLIGGGIAFIVGQPMAQRLLIGVVIGLGVVLLAPTIVA